MRAKLPKTVETEILFLNRHTCCICHDKNKDIQIHHIDQDNCNNDISNLAILCLDCHSKVTGKRGLGKSFSDLELRRYKKDWECAIEKEFSLPSLIQSKEMSKTLNKILNKVIKTESILKRKHKKGEMPLGEKVWRTLDSFARIYIKYLKLNLAKAEKNSIEHAGESSKVAEKAQKKKAILNKVISYAEARLRDEKAIGIKGKDLKIMRCNIEKFIKDLKHDLDDITVLLEVHKKLYLFTHNMSYGLIAMRYTIEQNQKRKEQGEKNIKALNTFLELIDDDISKYNKDELPARIPEARASVNK